LDRKNVCFIGKLYNFYASLDKWLNLRHHVLMQALKPMSPNLSGIRGPLAAAIALESAVFVFHIGVMISGNRSRSPQAACS